MAGSFTINYHGFDADLAKVVSRYPDETAKFMRTQATKWKKDCNSAGYGQYTGAAEAQSGKKKSIKPIPKSWKIEKETNLRFQVNEVQIRNTSRIFHLVENGHVKWIHGKNTGGFVPGKHWAEQTREEWKDKFTGNVAEYVDLMLRSHGL